MILVSDKKPELLKVVLIRNDMHLDRNILHCFSGAVEKQKLVYILNRDAQARLTISSPLEAHKANTLVFNMVGVDVGFENPTFACLEIDYEVILNIYDFILSV